MPLIQLESVVKDYALGETIVHAIKHVDLVIERAEFISIYGPSGSGKTTTLNLIGTLDKITSGRIFFDGQDLDLLSDNRLTEIRNRQIGFVFQRFNLIPVLSALENVMLPLQLNGTFYTTARKKALKQLEEVGLKSAIPGPGWKRGNDQEQIKNV